MDISKLISLQQANLTAKTLNKILIEFYNSAIDFAREKNHPEIVELISKGPIRSNQKLFNQNKKLNQKIILEIGKRISVMRKCRQKMHEYEYLEVIHTSVKNILGNT